jgi:hypothetical protein
VDSECFQVHAAQGAVNLENRWTLKPTQQMAVHVSARPTTVYGRTSYLVTLNDVERIQF